MNTIVYTIAPMSLGKNVKHLRALADIALEPLAEALGLERAAGRQKIYALEKRESRKSDIASLLARYFGIPVEKLLSEDLTTLSREQWHALRDASRSAESELRENDEKILQSHTPAKSSNLSDQAKSVRLTSSERLRAALSGLNVSPSALASVTGVGVDLASQWLAGSGSELTLDQAVAVQTTYGVNAVWLCTGKGEAGVAVRYDDEFRPLPITNWKPIPVVGMAQLGDNGHWSDLEYPVGHGDGYVDFPTHDPDAYAVKCEGDSMRPRIKSGEFVVVEPNHPIEPGDEVLVKSVDGRVMVKEFLYKRTGRTHLISTNDAHPQVSFADGEIEKMHFVAGIAKRAMWRPA